MVERNLIRTHSLSRQVAACRLSPLSVGCGARRDGRGGRGRAEMGGWLGLRVRDDQAILDGLDDIPAAGAIGVQSARLRVQSIMHSECNPSSVGGRACNPSSVGGRACRGAQMPTRTDASPHRERHRVSSGRRALGLTKRAARGSSAALPRRPAPTQSRCPYARVRLREACRAP